MKDLQLEQIILSYTIEQNARPITLADIVSNRPISSSDALETLGRLTRNGVCWSDLSDNAVTYSFQNTAINKPHVAQIGEIPIEPEKRTDLLT